MEDVKYGGDGILHLVVNTVWNPRSRAHMRWLANRSLIVTGRDLAVCNQLHRILHLWDSNLHLLDTTADMRASSSMDGHVSMLRTLHFQKLHA